MTDGASGNTAKKKDDTKVLTRKCFLFCVCCIMMFLFWLGGEFVWRIHENPDWFFKIIADHFAATVGLPFIAILSIAIVFLFDSQYDKVQFKFFGMEFSGPAGPVILWFIVFSTLISGTKLLW